MADNQQKRISLGSGSQVPAGAVSGESPLPGSEIASSSCVLMWGWGRELSGVSYKDTSPIMGPHIMAQSPPRDPTPNTSTLGIRFQHTNSGRMINIQAIARGLLASLFCSGPQEAAARDG